VVRDLLTLPALKDENKNNKLVRNDKGRLLSDNACPRVMDACSKWRRFLLLLSSNIRTRRIEMNIPSS